MNFNLTSTEDSISLPSVTFRINKEDEVRIWIAYIDESGTHGNSSHVVVASVLAAANAWQELRPRWEHALKSRGLTRYHAQEFNRRSGEYAQLTSQELNSCAAELLQAVNDTQIQYVVYVIERSLFESKKPTISVYDYLLATTIADLMIKGEADGIDALFVIIEQGSGLDTTLCDLLTRAAYARRLGPVGHISWRPKEPELFQLQVADMIAFESYKYITSPTKAVRRSYQAITSGHPLAPYLIHASMLDCDLPKAREFLDRFQK
ncbi:MAG: DUF3800 domain-containing protein [Candidatus Zixiibacteriota bacterium]